MHAESDSIYPDPGFWTKTSIIQLCYGILVNLTVVTIGLAFGFSAVLLPQLSVTEPKIPTSIFEESWIVSVLALATPFGCLFSGYLLDNFGRRTMLILCELPIAIGWILTGFASTARDIIIGFTFPETPYFILMKDTPEKAKENLKKFRSAKYNIDAEMEQLIDYKADNDIRRSSNEPKNELSWLELSWLPCRFQIRGLLGSITISITNITIFGVNQCFLYVQNALGFANTILAFGASSFLGCIYIYFFLPETKDLTLQEIEEFYNERRATLTSQRRIVSMHALSKQASLASRSLMKVT
ncbi:unnamed protein product [Parnassius apollo]|uniref:(apollo) hypothetical protein n=1 Tax=Parnassius apollo TaxID=110799 RepID=A0A8S3W4S0_PARAO|nr:unnamed protein product [Parnassius apollo]